MFDIDELLKRLKITRAHVKATVKELRHEPDVSDVVAVLSRLRDEAAQAFRDGTAAGRTVGQARLADMEALFSLILK